MAQHDIARILDLPKDEVEVKGAGLNHFQWMLEVRRRSTGEDLYPLLREKDATFDPAFMPLTRRLFRAFGLYPSCSDDHLGEYVPYGWEGGEEGYDFDADELGRVEMHIGIDAVNSGRAPVPPEMYLPSGERGVAVISGILNDSGARIESGVVYNQGAIANLPPDLAVEVPVTVDAGGIHPVAVGPLPDGIARLLHMQASAQQMAVDAAVHGSRELALQALLIDPVMNSTAAAEKILDELWQYNRPWIRKCI
jgi:alpha-galactosidase